MVGFLKKGLGMRNQQWLINGDPRGRALLATDFKHTEVEVPALADGQALVRTEYLGFDPAMKGQLENIPGYASNNNLGNVMPGSGIGEVVDSNAKSLPVGSKVMGRLGWQQLATVTPGEVQVVPDDQHLRARLGPLGTTGLTAYFGLLKTGRPEPGDMLVVSGAAGAVGSVVGQLGKLMGCTTVGVAGGAQKCEWLISDVGYDHAIDYKNDAIKAQLKECCPKGINVFFDNVGGPILNDALGRIAPHARVVICGGISRYEQAKLPPGPTNYFNIVFRQATMEGFLLRGYEHEFEVARSRIAGWIESGQLVYKEDIQEGFDNIPATLMRLFSGQNFGKQLLKL